MIISVIEALVNQLNVDSKTFEFGHGAEYWNNLLSDESTFPKCFLDQPITTEYQLTSGGYIGEFYPITLLFMYKSELEWLPTEHDDKCIEPANRAARQFIAICQASPLIDEVSDADALEFINLLDVNVSGKQLNIRLKLNVNASVCIPNG